MIKQLTALLIVFAVVFGVVYFVYRKERGTLLAAIPSADKLRESVATIKNAGIRGIASIFKPGPSDAGYLNQAQARKAAQDALARRRAAMFKATR